MQIRLRLVMVLDQAVRAETWLGQLRQHDFDCLWQCVASEPDFLQALDPLPNLILADYAVPGLGPLRVLDLLGEQARDIPLIVIGDRIGEEAAAQCIKRGAADYVDQSHLERLGDAVIQALCESVQTGQNQAEIALQESERRYQHIIQSIPMGMHMYQLADDGRLIFTGANPSADRILGIAHQQFIGETIQEAFPTLADTEIPARYSQVAAQGTPWSSEQIDYADNQIRGAFEVHAFQTSPGRMAATFLDITERKRAEFAVRLSEQKFRRIVEQSLDGIILMDESGLILEWNEGSERITGLSRSETLGTPAAEVFFNLLPARDRTPERYEQTKTRRADRITTRIARLNRPDGNLCIVEETNFPILAGTKPEIHLSASILHDITELAQTMDALRKSEGRYRTLVDNMGEGVVVLGPDQQIQFANEAALQIFGVPVLTGHHIEEFAEGNEFGALYSEIAEDLPAKVSHHEVEIIRPDGQRRILLATAVPQFDSDRRLGSILITFGDITARTQIEEALRESEGRYRLLAEHATDMISIHDVEGIYQYISPSCRTLLGYEPAALIGLSAYDLIHPDDQEAVRQNHRHTLQSGKVDPIHYRLRRRDGAYLWVETVGGTVQEPAVGAVSQIILTSRDVTERKQAEAAEREQRVMAEALRDTAAALTSTLDPSVVMTRILENVGRVVQHDAANILLITDSTAHAVYSHGYTIDHPVHLMPLPLTIPNLRRMIETGKPIAVPDTSADAEWQVYPDTRWIRSHAGAPLRVRGMIIGFLNLDSAEPGFFTEILAERLQVFADQAAVAIENAQLYDELRRRAAGLEEHVTVRTSELEQERAQLQAILDAMTEAVVYTNLTTKKILYVNPAFTELMGYRADEVTGQVLDVLEMLTQSADDYQALSERIHRALEHQRAWQGETRLRRKDDTQLEASVIVAPAIGAISPRLGQVTLIRDIGQEKALQAQKDRFIANAAHELRTPITNLKMRLYLTRKQPEKVFEHLAALENATDHMKTLVENLLDVSRFERGVISLDFQQVHLPELITQVLAEYHIRAEAKHIQLTVDLPAEPLHVSIDPDRIRQVIDNLLSNAINYTPEGGQVSVRLQFSGIDKDQYVILHVADTGIGIAADALPRVFEPFFRASENTVKGTGLGLAITKEIVDLHGGIITVKSQLKQGSTFSVWLPI